MTPRQSQYKRLLDDLVLRLALYWLTDGWRPEWSVTKRERLRQSNRSAVRELKQEIKECG